MDDAKLAAIVDAIVRELQTSGAVKGNGSDSVASASASSSLSAPSAVSIRPHTQSQISHLQIDLPDPTLKENRYKARVKNPKDANGLRALMDSTTARIGVGRAGPRYSTASLLLFQGDHAVTQDALYRDVDQKLLDQFNLFTVQTKVTGGKHFANATLKYLPDQKKYQLMATTVDKREQVYTGEIKANPEVH